MRLEQFEYVEAVVQYGSMTAAAWHLHLSQQNISKGIKQLEDELGIIVFSRTKKGSVLTSQGELIFQFAHEQLASYRQLKDTFRHMQQNQLKGTLSICTMNSGSSMIIPQMLCEFYKNYPQVILQIQDGSVLEVFQAVQLKQADLGIIAYSQIREQFYPLIPDGLQMIPLLKGKSYYWVQAKSVYAEKGFITMEEANKESLLMYDAMDLTLLRQLYNAHGLELSLGTTSRNLYLLGKLAANGWGVVPDILFYNDEMLCAYAFQKQSDLTAVPLKSKIDYSGVAYIIKRNQKKSALLAHALQFLQNLSVQKSKKEGKLCD